MRATLKIKLARRFSIRPVGLDHCHQIIPDGVAKFLDIGELAEGATGRTCPVDQCAEPFGVVVVGDVTLPVIEEGVLAVDLGSIEDAVDELHLGDARSVDGDIFDEGILREEIGIHEDIVEFGNPSVSVADDPDEVWSALVDFFEASADDASEICFFLGETPT
ncbi:MAG: hypothetical protein R3F28_16625 [Candidatus Kapaibacterium sp.]